VYWHGAGEGRVIRNPQSVIRGSGREGGQDAGSKPGSLHCDVQRAHVSGRDDRNSEMGLRGTGRNDRDSDLGVRGAGWDDVPRIITYREFIQNGLSPRMLGQAIVERTGRERIREIYLSPDAFAQRTSEASIAEQLGDVLVQNGLPRPVPATDDRIGGWQLMYQLLERDAWVIAENCGKLIECLPQLVRDEKRVGDVRKVEGDDAADAARYGIVPGARWAGVGAMADNAPGAEQAPPKFGEAPRFVPGIPVAVQIERQISAEEPTSRAIHWQRLEAEAKRQLGPRRFGRKR